MKTIITQLGTAAMSVAFEPAGDCSEFDAQNCSKPVPFTQLSREAQRIIVDAAMGKSGMPEDTPPNVIKEIEWWLNLDDEEYMNS